MGDRGTSQPWVPIVYRDFYDEPRCFVFMEAGRCYLFDSAFDEEAEDFTDDYQVFELPFRSLSDLPTGSWTDLPARALRRLGSLPVKSLRRDACGRHVDPSMLFELDP